jgi:hypothetical protein
MAGAVGDPQVLFPQARCRHPGNSFRYHRAHIWLPIRLDGWKRLFDRLPGGWAR